MKAIIAKEKGGPEVLQIKEVPTLLYGHDELLIEVRAIGINPVDSYVRQNGYFGVTPEILGLDFAGIVSEIGTSVNQFKIGDRVVGLRPSPKESGAYAQFTTAAESQLALIPAAISFETAASLPVAALTAYQVLHYEMKLQPQQEILIHAGAGGVGIFAIQFAKLIGAYVYATSSPENFEFLKNLGAHQTINYKDKDFSVAKNIDAVLDPIGGETQSASLVLLKKGGILVSVLPYPIKSKRIDYQEIKAITRSVSPSGSDLQKILNLLAQGKIRTEIQTIIPFADIVRAHTLIDTKHTRGKIVLNEIQ